VFSIAFKKNDSNRIFMTVKRIDCYGNDWYNNFDIFVENCDYEGEVINMKSTGIVRKVDELGRVVIPIELRRTLGIAEKDALEIFVDGDRIILKKYEPACIFTGNADDLVFYRGKMISKQAIRELVELLNNPSSAE
jgi:AbrB family transcriptional regulator, transcriptional pleiotropic regulator of transition state genes